MSAMSIDTSDLKNVPIPPAFKQYTALTDQDQEDLEKLNIDPNAYKMYWARVEHYWNAIYQLMLRGHPNGIKILNNLLDKSLTKYVDVEATFNEINRQELPISKGIVELYITPCLKKEAIPVMKKLYEERKTLPNAYISCYRAFHPQDNIIAHIEFDEFKVCYEDFGYQSSISYDETNPLLNLVILVKQPIANKILEKKTITFNKLDNTTSKREVWAPTKSNAPDLILLNIVGEYNLINHIGYIEFVPADDPQIVNDAVFIELADIRKELEMIFKWYNYKMCNYCSHNTLQVNIKRCSRCGSVYYCSKHCQIADWKTHKITCKVPIGQIQN